MAQLVSTKCPHCGAPLQIEKNADRVVCAYCKHTSLIQRPHQPPRPATAEMPVIQLPQAQGSRFLPWALSSGILVLGGIGVAVFALTQSAVEAGEGTSALLGIAQQAGVAQQAALPRFYFSDQPFLFDVNDDGTLDILGKSNTPGGPAWLAAYDGKDGKELWRSTELAKDQSEGAAFRGLFGHTLILVDALGKMQAYNARTGQPQWASLLGETARDACAGDGFARFTTSDGAHHAVDLTTGKAFAGSTTGPCASLATSGKESGAGYRIVGWSEFKKLGLPSLHGIEGLSAHRALVLDDKSLAFLLGRKSKGTGFAMVAATRGRNVLWQDAVPGVDPMTTEVNVTTQQAAYAHGKLVIPYHMRDNKAGVRLAAFDAETGKRLWDVLVHEKTQANGGLALTQDTIYIGSWTSLYVLDAATGERRFTVGTEF